MGLDATIIAQTLKANWHADSTRNHGNPREKYGMPYETHFVSAKDGCKIALWYMPAEETASKKLAIVGHQSWTPANKSGMHTNWKNGMIKQIAIDYMLLYKVLHDEGYHVIAYDLRNHGESEKRLPAAYGEVEFMDAWGVMSWIQGHTVLKDCNIALLTFCASGATFLKANSKFPELFKNVKCLLTTNLMDTRRQLCDYWMMFKMVDDVRLDAAFAAHQKECEDNGSLIKSPDIKLCIDNFSAKPWVADFKKPVLWCDPLHDICDDHKRQVEIFDMFGGPDFPEEKKQLNQFHFIGKDQPGIYKTKTNNRCEGYNFYQTNGADLMKEFLRKHMDVLEVN